jgi:hypothetical protein
MLVRRKLPFYLLTIGTVNMVYLLILYVTVIPNSLRAFGEHCIT